MSTANSPSEHIHVIPQPPKRVPVERAKTRGFVYSQAVLFGKTRLGSFGLNIDPLLEEGWRWIDICTYIPQHGSTERTCRFEAYEKCTGIRQVSQEGTQSSSRKRQKLILQF